MVRFLTPLVFCLFAFVVQGADNLPTVTGKVPKITIVGGVTNDMGKINSYEKRSILFRLKNVGESPLDVLKLTPSCSCVSASADKMQLQPQEDAVVTLVLDASMVHGVFKRGLWVETNDPVRSRIYLSLRGEVIPLFTGQPGSRQQFSIANGAAYTNRFTLTQSETNVFLGTPIIQTNTNKLLATANMATKVTEGKTSYEVTLVVTGLASGRHSLTVSIPVEGLPNLRPIEVTYDARIGLELKALPPKVMLINSDQPLTRHLRLMASEKNLATNSLTWTPQREGVSVQLQPTPKSSFLTVTLTFSPEAVAKLLKEKDAGMAFHYPNYKSATVSFISKTEPAADTNSAAQAPAK